ncbi:MAG: galactose/methyl galactoside ABC transporter permease MglC [Clostridiales Family XIII bacterium]|jgi:methyl-galactoside transport system permease protein|nr:galactose/methyl galactoside ABC transporter permease MglC [Clostridiales Family XIII bacterium]
MENARAKIITSRKYGAGIMAGGAAVIVLGVILSLIRSALGNVFELPQIVIIIGVGVLIYGCFQYMHARNNNEEKEFSKKTAMRFITDNAIMISLLILIVIICFIEPRFMQIRVVLDILTISSPRLIIALGICFSLLIAGTDLSAGRMVGLAAVVSTSMLQNADYGNRFFPNLGQINILIPIVIAIAACVFFGVINGFLVARFDMHPFIATLAVQVIVYGATSLYFDMPPNNSQPIGGVRSDFVAIGQTKLFEIPGTFPGISILVPIALVICVVIWFVLNKTVFGKNVYAIGGNREAAVVSGVKVFRTLIMIFVLGGALYGFAGILEGARTAGATNAYGFGYELDAIAACVVGGVSLNGGIGKVSGIVSGVLIFSVIQYGLQFINVSPMWQQVIKGIIIAVAVAIDMSKYRRKS